MEVYTPLKRILVGLGGTSFTAVAVKDAAELAEAHGAHLTGVTVLDLEGLQKQVAEHAKGFVPNENRVRRQVAVTRPRVEASINRFKEVCTHCRRALHHPMGGG
jgi:nucleotide-binding universal stress UspA family protein